jgi:tetratricopeptide (TPR) repeat protein
MVRFFLLSLSLFFLFNASVFAQAEIAAQRFEQGLANAKRGHHEQALRDFQKALENYKLTSDLSDKFAAKINYNVGVCLYRTGRASEAVAFLKAAIELAKNKYGQAFHALGIVEGELGNPEAAKQAFTSAVRLNQRDGESWFDLAMIHLQEKDLTSAARAFQKAILYRSVDAAYAHNNLGVIAAIGSDWFTAEKQFEAALLMSGGKLAEAARNLNICRSQNISREMVAKLEFVNRENKENQKETEEYGK